MCEPMIRVNRSGALLGVQVSGVDLCRGLDEKTICFLKKEWIEHGVLVFRDQDINDQDHVRFARNFGQLQKFGNAAWSNAPEIFRSANVDALGNILSSDDERVKLLKINWLWHKDSSYLSSPAKGVVLRAIEVIDEGGDTIFSDNAAAYEALSTAMKKRIARLLVRHSFAYMLVQQNFPPLTSDEAVRLPTVEHPLVRQHSDGRRSLYLSPPYMEKIVGWDQADSLALFDELTDWATQDRFIFRHRWRPHDVIMWDNGWTMHKVMPVDLGRDKRIMHGTTIMGDEPIVPIALMGDW